MNISALFLFLALLVSARARTSAAPTTATTTTTTLPPTLPPTSPPLLLFPALNDNFGQAYDLTARIVAEGFVQVGEDTAAALAGDGDYYCPLLNDYPGPGTCNFWCWAQVSRTVWFKYTPPTDQSLRFDLSTLRYPGVVSAWVYQGEPAPPYTPIAGPCATDSDCYSLFYDNRQTTTLDVLSGVTYYILVETLGLPCRDPGFADSIFTMIANPVAPPPNDYLKNALSLIEGTPSLILPSSGLKFSSAEPGGETACARRLITQSVWYKYQPTTDTTVSVSYGSLAGCTCDDRFMAAYTSAVSSPSFADLDPLQCAEVDFTNGCCDPRSPRLSFPVTAGQTYYFQLSTSSLWQPLSGSVTLIVPPFPSPLAVLRVFDVSNWNQVGYAEHTGLATSVSGSACGTAGMYSFRDRSSDDPISPKRLFYPDSPLPGAWQQFRIDYGDGSSATSTTPTGCPNCCDGCPWCCGASDSDPFRHGFNTGVYNVTLNVTTADNRTSSVILQLNVEAHDVAAVGLKAPRSARVGQSVTLTLQVTSASAETVRISWQKTYPDSPYYGYAEFAADYGMSVPATRQSPYSIRKTYRFTAEDGAHRQVQFRVQVDMNPVCNRPGCPCLFDSRADNNAVLALTDVTA